jgi:hypothetical protein
VGVVIGLASAIALAFPLQWWLSGVATSAPAKEGGPSDHDVTMATWWSMAVGLAVAVAVAIWIRRSSRRSSVVAEPPLVEKAEHGPLTRGPVSRAPGAGRPRG